MTDRINILYILGAGRSGTTLLDSLIGQLGDAFSLGQFVAMPVLCCEEWRVCACGAKLSECIFWRKFFQDFHQDLTEIQDGSDPYFTMKSKKRELVKVAAFFLRGRKMHISPSYQLRQANMLDYIRKHSGCQWLVDGSKQRFRLLALLASDLFNVRVIWMIRDGRGYVASKRRSKSKRPVGPFLSILSWVYQNALSLMVYIRLAPEERMIVRFEDFVTNTGVEINKIYQWLGNERKISAEEVAYCDPGATHMPAGNSIRMEGRRKIRKVDDRAVPLKDNLVYYTFGAWFRLLIDSLWK